jgi:hypothetical protein
MIKLSLFLAAGVISFFIANHFILSRLKPTNKLRIWWEKNICSSKDLEPYD